MKDDPEFAAEFKDLIMENRWDATELDDLYYGQTLYGWELVKEDTNTDYQEMIKLGIIKTI
ncbi:MAG: hypothetical protein V3V84_08860 [Candidatus Bathyarchaeia archaeon]